MDIKKEYLSYNQAKNNSLPYDDKFGILSYALSDGRRKAFFANPNLTDYDKIMIRICLDDNTVIARSMSFVTKILFDGKLEDTRSGSSLFVHEDYRQYGIGADLMFEIVKNKSNKFCLCAGLSDMVLPMYKALKYTIFSFPIYSKLIHTRPFLENRKIQSWLIPFIAPILDFGLKCFYPLKIKKENKRLCAIEVKTVPTWVDDIVFQDSYQYMEVHDHKWLQWNLDNVFYNSPKNRQSFFIIKIDDIEAGFFMLTERVSSGIVTGKIVEWGIKDNLMNEEDILGLAIPQFSKNVDVIKLLTQDEGIKGELSKSGFRNNDHFEIAFKDLTKSEKDYKDVNKWRIRYGYADTIMSK